MKIASMLFGDKEEEIMRPTLVETPNNKVVVRYPKDFQAVKKCADALLNGNTLIVSYENLSEEDSCRVADYLSGLSYSIDATMEQIAVEMIMYAPSKVGNKEAAQKASSF